MRHLPVSTSTRAHTRITYLRGLYVHAHTRTNTSYTHTHTRAIDRGHIPAASRSQPS
jgi:hypothetical protein